MTYPQQQPAPQQPSATMQRPSWATVAARVVAVVFGIVEALLLIRIALLGLGAERGNDIVAWILRSTQGFVGPFEDMFRVSAVRSGGSVLDIAAIAALLAVAIVELVILAIVRIPRRSEDV